jgi:hypothetical protein
MSKNMLDPIIRALVGVPESRLGVALDIVNRLNSDRGDEWSAHLKSVLRSGIPNEAKQPPASKPPLLKLVNASVQLDAIAAYDPAELKARPGLWVFDEFVMRVPSKAKPVENLGPLSLNSHELTKTSYDCDITADLGKNCVFDESELCARIDQMISKQQNGEAGDLLNNGYRNIFYVAGFVVRVRWDSGRRRWDVRAGSLGDYWFASDRVFSRN